MLHGYCSDHDIPYITIKESDLERGPGFWRFNNSLLLDEEYTKNIKSLIKEKKSDSYSSHIEKWDIIKMEIRGYTIQYTARKQRAEENKLRLIDNKINFFQKCLQENPNNDIPYTLKQIVDRLTELKNEKESLIDLKVKRSIARNRKNWLQHREKNSKYFFNLEKVNYKRKNRYKLRIEDEIVDDPKIILKEQDQYYEKLYTSANIEFNLKYFDTVDFQKIDQNDKDSMDLPITNHNIRDALWSMKKNKAPGNDGLTVEFIKHFWNELKTIVCRAIQQASETGFSINSRRGIISLMEKPGHDPLEIKNWRPLSLLNVDYKILSKILAQRLENVLPQIIHRDQVGFVKGRSMNDNLLDLLSSIEYSKQKADTILIGYDFRQAFDSVKWNILYSIMRKFNFGEKYIKYVQALYENIESCTINCGYTSKYFKITQSLRQGCPLSAPCFLLMVEALGQKLRTSNIQGLKVCTIAKTSGQFADDLWTLILADQTNLQITINTVQQFSDNTGLELNYDKTQAMRISVRKSNAKYYVDKQIQWSDKIKVLGIEIYPEIEKTVEKNYAKLLDKIRNVLSSWQHRTLTMLGKIQVVNTLVVTLATLKMSVLPSPPDTFFAQSKKLITKFIWDGKHIVD